MKKYILWVVVLFAVLWSAPAPALPDADKARMLLAEGIRKAKEGEPFDIACFDDGATITEYSIDGTQDTIAVTRLPDGTYEFHYFGDGGAYLLLVAADHDLRDDADLAAVLISMDVEVSDLTVNVAKDTIVVEWVLRDEDEALISEAIYACNREVEEIRRELDARGLWYYRVFIGADGFVHITP